MKDNGGKLTNLEIAHSLAEQIMERLVSDSLGNLSDLKSFLAFYLVLVSETMRNPSSFKAGSLQKGFKRKTEEEEEISEDKGELNVVRAYAVEIVKKLEFEDVSGLASLKSTLEAELLKVESSMLVLMP
jgi:hypothetical protein